MQSAIALLLCAGCAIFGTVPARAAPARAPAAAIGQASGPVALDGDLDTPVWRAAPAIALTQQNPYPGRPTPFATSVRLLRAGGHIYLGIRCDGSQPDADRRAHPAARRRSGE